MRYLLCLILCLTLLASLPPSGRAAGPAPQSKDKCPVCGMFVSRYPDWLATITFSGGESVSFDGPKDLFTFYLDMARYRPGKNRSAVTAVRVKDYYSLKSIDARSAFFVSGSDVYGPMGRELVPFASQSDAQAFLKDHKGEKVLRFDGITPAVLQRLQQ
jgi:nitrous oxide reductase accessory protein NosL